MDDDGDPRRRYVQVADEVLAAIGVGRLSAGDRLPNERELARICGASRQTVRDALLALELFGVISVSPGSGRYVTAHGAARRVGSRALIDSPPLELLEARVGVEPSVARLCAGRLSPSEAERLGRLIDDCEEEGRRAGPDQFETFLSLSHQFHVAVAQNCGNSIMTDITRQLVDVTAHPLWMVVNGLHVRDQGARSVQIAEHRDILAAIVRGDKHGAADAMSDHLSALSQRIFGRTRSTRTIRRQRPRGAKAV